MTEDPSELRRRFGAMIRQHRRSIEPPMSQKDLADRLGIAQSAVSDWERGENWPTIPFLIVLFKTLDLELGLLLRLADDNNGENPAA
jgi:transcriptional regulator with XRE-family HTH domain